MEILRCVVAGGLVLFYYWSLNVFFRRFFFLFTGGLILDVFLFVISVIQIEMSNRMKNFAFIFVEIEFYSSY